MFSMFKITECMKINKYPQVIFSQKSPKKPWSKPFSARRGAKVHGRSHCGKPAEKPDSGELSAPPGSALLFRSHCQNNVLAWGTSGKRDGQNWWRMLMLRRGWPPNAPASLALGDQVGSSFCRKSHFSLT